MTTVPVLVILSAASALGLYLLLLFLRGERRQGLIALHLLLGFGGLETLVMLLHGTPTARPRRGRSRSARSLRGCSRCRRFPDSSPHWRGVRRSRRTSCSAPTSPWNVAGFALFLAWVSSG